MAATKSAAPTIFPKVTGIKLDIKKLCHPLTPTRLDVETWAEVKLGAIDGSLATNIPRGMKNMLATLCSNPMVTKAIMGNHMATILLMTSSALMASQTASALSI